MLTSSNVDLATRWLRLRGEQPALRIRDAAATLGVSEAELVALGVGQTATPLAADWPALFTDLPSVGRVMCLTRNEHCVHERQGRFEDVQVSGPHGLVLGPDIDLRLFLGSWRYGFAVREPLKGGERQSLQFSTQAARPCTRSTPPTRPTAGLRGVIVAIAPKQPRSRSRRGARRR